MEDQKIVFLKQLNPCLKIESFLTSFNQLLDSAIKNNPRDPIKLMILEKNDKNSQSAEQVFPNLPENFGQLSEWKINLDESYPCYQNHTLTPQVLEDIQLCQNSSGEREKHGLVYTPKPIARAMVDYTIEEWIKSKIIGSNSINLLSFENNPIKRAQMQALLESNRDQSIIESLIAQKVKFIEFILNNLCVLDPCVGSGVFILALIQKITQIFRENYLFYWLVNKRKDPKGIDPYLALNEINHELSLEDIENPNNFISIDDQKELIQDEIKDLMHFLTNNLKMFDLSEISLRITMIRIKAALWSIFGLSIKDDLQSLKLFQIVNDALMEKWTGGKFVCNCIIGNPPYVSSDAMGKYYSTQQLQILKQTFQSCIKKGSKPDLFFYFIQKSIDEMEDDGLVAFIIPNRILANNYAEQLRINLFAKTQLIKVIDFTAEIEVFPNINVHPCILIYRHSEDSNQVGNNYSASLVKDPAMLDQLDFYQLPANQIPFQIINQYGVILTEISPIAIQLLELTMDLPRVGSLFTIHEATRQARFQDHFPANFSFRISTEKWDQLETNQQSMYIREVRGQEIWPFTLKKNQNYLTLPELQKNNEKNNDSSMKVVSKMIKELPLPKLYIRELGKKFFIAFDPGISPSIGYGGVYYITPEDIHNSIDGLNLFSILAFFASHFPLILYRILFSAGSWGDALKFRSSYLHQLPFLPTAIKINTQLGFMLYFLSEISQLNTSDARACEPLINKIIQNLDLIMLGFILSLQPTDDLNTETYQLWLLCFKEIEDQRDYQHFLDRPQMNIDYSAKFQLWSAMFQELENNDDYRQIRNKLTYHPLYSIFENK